MTGSKPGEELAQEDKRTGRFNLLISPRLKAAITAQAQKDWHSTNDAINQAIAEYIEARTGKRPESTRPEIRLYTLAEVAGIIGVTHLTAWKYVKAGKLRGRRIGGQWRFTEAAVLEAVSPPEPAKARAEEKPCEEGGRTND